MASEKRCHYEVLGLSRECTTDEIRAAYKKLALQRHPDKLVKSGLSEAQATAQFQELAQAYEILSDPKERAWYDSHRSQILFSEPNSSNSVPNSLIPNLFSFFSNTVFSGYSDSGRGFYKVYSDLFDKIYANEINFVKRLGLGLGSVREAPVMGNLESPYVQVTAFYNYWLGFCTVMDFCWVDEYDAMAGPNRKSRRMMEEENKKLRKKARRDYNETVRGLAEFVKKRDKRVIDMTVKRNLEMEKKKEEERERKRKMEKEKVERVRAYVEPEWARAKELEEEEEEQRNGGMEEEEEEERKERELYCVICKKKFKSDKQWKNHEQSKKHKEKVAEFRESLVDEEEEVEVEEKEKEMEEDELAERIGDDLGIGEEENGDDSDGNSGSDDDDDEMGVLEAMVAGHKSKKNVGSRGEDETHDSDDGVEAMEYDNRKSTRRNRGGKKERGKNNGGGEAMRGAANEIDEELVEELAERIGDDLGIGEEENDESRSEDRPEDESADGVEAMEYDNRKSMRRNRRRMKESGKKNGGGEAMRDASATNEIDDRHEESNGHDNSNKEESSSHAFAENENNGNDEEGDKLARKKKTSNQPIDKKGAGKKETDTKSKNSSKGKKAKATSKNSSNMCDTCGEEFESRNKLHMHLGDTGHAKLKYR